MGVDVPSIMNGRGWHQTLNSDPRIPLRQIFQLHPTSSPQLSLWNALSLQLTMRFAMPTMRFDRRSIFLLYSTLATSGRNKTGIRRRWFCADE